MLTGFMTDIVDYLLDNQRTLGSVGNSRLTVFQYIEKVDPAKYRIMKRMTYRNDKGRIGSTRKHNTSPQFLNITEKNNKV